MSWSYTKLSTWMQCPAKYNFKYNLKVQDKQNEYAARGTSKHLNIELYMKQEIKDLPTELTFYQQFLDGLVARGAKAEVIVRVDREWVPVTDGNPYWGNGKLDALLPEPDRIHGWDWKTGKIYEEDHQKQRELYACMIAGADPLPVNFHHVYTDLGKNRGSTFLPSDIKNLREKWTQKITQMEQAKDFPCNPQFLCRYCAFSKIKGGPCRF